MIFLFFSVSLSLSFKINKIFKNKKVLCQLFPSSSLVNKQCLNFIFAFRNKTNTTFNMNRILLGFLFAYLWTNLNFSVLHSNIYMLPSPRTQYNTVLQNVFFQAQLLTMENALINCCHLTKYTVWENTELWYTFKNIRWYILLMVQIKSERMSH